jgi:hypothetical protein
MPLALEAATLSRMRSAPTSRSNRAKESRMLRVSRPIEVVVLKCCATETMATSCRSPRHSRTSRVPRAGVSTRRFFLLPVAPPRGEAGASAPVSSRIARILNLAASDRPP